MSEGHFILLVFPSQGNKAVTMWQKAQLFYQGTPENEGTDNWLQVYSPVPITCVYLCYLIIIWVGPKLTARQQPVSLRPVLLVYSFAMVWLSAYMFSESWGCITMDDYHVQEERTNPARVVKKPISITPDIMLCQPVDYSFTVLLIKMARVCWWFYFSKVMELSDTVITIHPTYNLAADSTFPDSMNVVVLAYSLSLVVLVSNFYYHSYLTKSKI
ncbi:LOW QUALITY PROTEIN: ELOVL fatty acid elongase 8a [Kryptolebias marmoratus]|uniref:LOW QUALITY PROTEIN: ELOVL fatty acid elongase 8a n=1 Tax=Kryptolebias marmoratus TaxID=37003 RepID=UPI0018ACAA24|nr:LOW QUALITY PROTEIN: ELOVL fatty acid elongase 8a [Kryptolebias marmoratus]